MAKVRQSSLLNRFLIFVFENSTLFCIKNDIVFRLIGAIIQPPCETQLLLRVGQTISATVSLENSEKDYPFYIAELEQILIEHMNKSNLGKENYKNSEEIQKIYLIFLRNRLLNMIFTILAHSSGQINNQ